MAWLKIRNRRFALGFLATGIIAVVVLIGLALWIPPHRGPIGPGDRFYKLLLELGLWFPNYPAFLERVDPTDRAQRFHAGTVLREHLLQYQFAKKYCQDHNIQSVADIASGTCYGMKILKEVVPTVDGYDKVRLCDNYVIDLDKESWSKQYDVIVSFETMEHLEKPDFFLANAARSAPVLILSTPMNETPGSNPFHKQFWSTEQLRGLLERYFTCQYYHQSGEWYEPGLGSGFDLVAVCTRRSPPLPASPTP